MSAEGIELRPARWQLWAMTLASVVGLGLFAYVCWVLMPAPWRWLIPPPIAAYGLVLARSNLRRLRATRVRADSEGVSFDDGTREGRSNRQVRWDDVEGCVIEQHRTGFGYGGEVSGTSSFLILKSAASKNLFSLSVQLLSRDDLARLLRFIKAELESRNALFDVPAKWYRY